MKQLLLASFYCTTTLLGSFTLSFGQSREFRYFVEIPTGTFVHVSRPTTKSVVRTIPAGSVVKTKSTTTTVIAGKTTSETDTISPSIILAAPLKIATKKTATEDFVFTTTKRRRANIVQSKDTLYLNYQLFPNPDSASKKAHWWSTSVNPRAKPWLPTAESKLPMEFPQGGFSRKNTYYVKLNDRQSKHFASRSIELAALIIPFQYRPGYTNDNNKRTYGQLNVNLNLTTYLGVKFGGITYRYRRYEPLLPNKVTFSMGPFLSVTRVSLDSTNTRLATDRHNLYRNIATLSTGLAAVLDIYDFRVGVFGGKDFAIGSEQWDFNRRYWVGLGVGYKLKIFDSL